MHVQQCSGGEYTSGLSGASAVHCCPALEAKSFDETRMGAQPWFSRWSPCWWWALWARFGRISMAMATRHGYCAQKNITLISIFTETPAHPLHFFLRKRKSTLRLKQFTCRDRWFEWRWQPDVVVTESDGLRVAVLLNTSTLGNISFYQQTISLASGTKSKQVRNWRLGFETVSPMLLLAISQRHISNSYFKEPEHWGQYRFAAPTIVKAPHQWPIQTVCYCRYERWPSSRHCPRRIPDGYI